MKKRCSLLLAALFLSLLCAAPVPAAAALMPVQIAGNTYFDESESKFLYYVDAAGTRAVRSSAADGMITDQAVSVKADPGVAIGVYRNGELVADGASGTFRDPGEYVVMYLGGTVSERVLVFTVVPEVSNAVRAYSLPRGFEMTGVTLDGVPITYSGNGVTLEQEGAYDIRYRCVKTGIPYQLLVRTDYTAPTLSLEEVSGGVARGPVDISEAGQADVVNIYLNGEKIARKDVLTQSGEYYIELADEAGNKTTYTFSILIYFDGSSWLFFLIVLLAAAGLVVYLLHARKHLRVR